MFDFVASLAPRRSLVWDCATGNGQAAVGLAARFERVVATDASAEQLRHAVQAPNIEYRVATAESSGLADRSVMLVTVAQALHWLNHRAFYDEVRRVTAAGGALAAWSYGTCHAGGDIEADLREFEYETVGPYWNPERKWVDEGYRTIPFAFPELPAPALELTKEWTLTQFGEYLRSWSAVVKYARQNRLDPVAPLMERISKRWGSAGGTRTIRWPLALRVGRVG